VLPGQQPGDKEATQYEIAHTSTPRRQIHPDPADRYPLDPPEDWPSAPEEIAQAQAHATLALVDAAKGPLHEPTTLRQHLSGN
jgi:hypothetical protein